MVPLPSAFTRLVAVGGTGAAGQVNPALQVGRMSGRLKFPSYPQVTTSCLKSAVTSPGFEHEIVILSVTLTGAEADATKPVVPN